MTDALISVITGVVAIGVLVAPAWISFLVTGDLTIAVDVEVWVVAAAFGLFFLWIIGEALRR